MMSTIKKDRQKLKQLIHYVAYRCAHNPAALGAVKLNKVLWFADQGAYLSTGVPITGERYIKKQMGPVSSTLMPIVDELEQEGALAVRKLDNQHTQYLALSTPDVSMFKSDELRIVEDAIQMVCHEHTAQSISRRSHDMIWKLAELDEEIPYHAIHAGRLDEIESDDVEWAREQLTA